MADTEKKIWGIHTTDEELFLKNHKIAIGWREIGNLREIPDNRDDFKTKYSQVYPDAKKGIILTNVGMLYRFCCEMNIGDYVIYPSKSDRMINIGEVTGDYTYVANAPGFVLLKGRRDYFIVIRRIRMNQSISGQKYPMENLR